MSVCFSRWLVATALLVAGAQLGCGAAAHDAAPVPNLPATDLPPEPSMLPPSELEGEPSCGPFRASELESDVSLLDDRLRFRFVAGGAPEGSADRGRVMVQRDGVSLFIGAFETFMAGDDYFSRRAAKLARFGGRYDPVVIASEAGPLVAGLVRDVHTDGDSIALAHGWFLDVDRNAIDVAVFASRSALRDVTACRRFAARVLASVDRGGRRLRYGSADEVETRVSFAAFRYRLPPGWTMTSSQGIHDFAHIHFRRRGIFPYESVELGVGLDSHPGDATPGGASDGERAGRLFGLPLVWKLTKDATTKDTTWGASAVSTTRVGHDLAIASLQWARTEAERDEAIRFAESIHVGK